MKVRSLIILAAAAAVATAAPISVQAQNTNQWSGFYAGLNAGGLWSSTAATINQSNIGGGFNGVGSGFVGGAQVGYNYLIGPVLLGGEIDFQGTTLNTNVTGGTSMSSINANATLPWFSTFRVRAGYPVGGVMPYVTGGAVWGQQRLQGTDSATGYFDASSNFWTYAVGGGVEGHLNDRLSAKLEYLWLGTPDSPLSTPASASVSERSIGNLVRVGVNYRF
jgi:outer membrane immunogenic protein